MIDQKPYRLIAVAAMAANRVIGKNGHLPWHLSEDLKLFKKRTSGHPIVMGRKTCESFGKPLPKRRNIVLSRSMKEPPEGFELVQSVNELDDLRLEGDVFVIGGAQIYDLLLPDCDEFYLSLVHAEYEGDTLLAEFEHLFSSPEVVATYPEFEIRLYQRGEPATR